MIKLAYTDSYELCQENKLYHIINKETGSIYGSVSDILLGLKWLSNATKLWSERGLN